MTNRRLSTLGFVLTMVTIIGCTQHATDDHADRAGLLARCRALDQQSVSQRIPPSLSASLTDMINERENAGQPCGPSCGDLLRSGAFASLIVNVGPPLSSSGYALPEDPPNSINHAVRSPGYWRLTPVDGGRCREPVEGYGLYRYDRYASDPQSNLRYCALAEKVDEQARASADLQVEVFVRYEHDSRFAYRISGILARRAGDVVFRRLSLQRSLFPSPRGIPTAEGECSSFPVQSSWADILSTHVLQRD